MFILVTAQKKREKSGTNNKNEVAEFKTFVQIQHSQSEIKKPVV